jgi:hypothetical protein
MNFMAETITQILAVITATINSHTLSEPRAHAHVHLHGSRWVASPTIQTPCADTRCLQISHGVRAPAEFSTFFPDFRRQPAGLVLRRRGTRDRWPVQAQRQTHTTAQHGAKRQAIIPCLQGSYEHQRKRTRRFEWHLAKLQQRWPRPAGGWL